jgi:Tfp pilus assembly protein PilF
MSNLNSITVGGISMVAALLVSVPTTFAQQPPRPQPVQTLPAASAALDRATALLSSGQTAEAATALETALRADPNYPPALSQLAWIRATSTDPKLRNPAQAVSLATRLVDQTNYKGRATVANWSKAFRLKSLYQLTVAYIAAGDIRQAEVHAQLVLEASTRMNESQRLEASTQLLSAAQTTKQAIDRANPALATAAMRSVGAACAAGSQTAVTTLTAASTPPVDMTQFPNVTVPLTQ